MKFLTTLYDGRQSDRKADLQSAELIGDEIRKDIYKRSKIYLSRGGRREFLVFVSEEHSIFSREWELRMGYICIHG